MMSYASAGAASSTRCWATPGMMGSPSSTADRRARIVNCVRGEVRRLAWLDQVWAGGPGGVQSVLFYMLVYIVSNLAVFACISATACYALAGVYVKKRAAGLAPFCVVASAGTAVSKIIGKAVRDGKLCYYIDDGVYHTFSGVVFDHCQYHLRAFKKGPVEVCSVFGPTCDALDVVSMAEQLPGTLRLGDLLYADKIGAYSHASSTHFNGFPPAKVVHVNRAPAAAAALRAAG